MNSSIERRRDARVCIVTLSCNLLRRTRHARRSVSSASAARGLSSQITRRIALSVWREMRRSRVPEGELATQSSHARAPPSSIDVLGGDVCRDGRLPLVAILQQLLLIVKQLLQPRCPRCARRGSPERPRLQGGLAPRASRSRTQSSVPQRWRRRGRPRVFQGKANASTRWS